MPRLIMLMTVLLLTASSLIGQGFDLGLKGGLNFSNIDIKDIDEVSASSKTGYHIGVFAKLMFTEKIGIHPEVYYSVQGSKLTVSSVKSEISTNYLQIPLLFRFSPNALLNIHAGPQFGVLLKAENKAAGVVTDVKENFKNGDFALAIGAGLDLPMGLSLTLRYVRGLSAVYEISDSERTNMFQLSVGYQMLGL